MVYNDYCKILRTNKSFKLKVLNFYGGAGIGKSTIIADFFSKLKRKGHKTELVGEYTKCSTRMPRVLCRISCISLLSRCIA